MFERILVPLDGSARAEVILPQIARILNREDSEILLLRVVNIPESAGLVMRTNVRHQEREEAQQYLHTMALRFGQKASKVHARLAEGWPADVILETAKTEGATMIAISTHGRSGMERWAIGSVAEKVARSSDVPVLMVRSFRRGSKGDLEPMVPAELPFRRILVPVDGSVTSMSVIGSAEKVAELYGSEVMVLHVLPPYVPADAMLPGMEASFPILRPEPIRPEEDEVTEKAADRFRHAGLKVTRLTVEGEPASEILDLCKNRAADLIALGTHGRTGFSRWALGSVAERVL
ncbi:MAG TPA: universal stress protein, partial [Planctomycetota bacterium]|nr:universal stress protein [Planctomycetota bacterium]